MPHYIINARFTADSLGSMRPEEPVSLESWLRESANRLEGRLIGLFYHGADYALIGIIDVPSAAAGVLLLALAQLKIFEGGINIGRVLVPSELDA